MTRNSKKGEGGIKRIANAFFYSIDGFRSAWSDESAFRQVFVMSFICFVVAVFIGRSFFEVIILVLPCVLSLIVELINSAIENAVDFTGLDLNPFAKKAKDMGSSAQFVALVFWFFVWVCYLLDRFIF